MIQSKILLIFEPMMEHRAPSIIIKEVRQISLICYDEQWLNQNKTNLYHTHA